MSEVTTLFEQYKQLRLDGIDHQLALQKLRPRIERLDAAGREEFVQKIKVWTASQRQLPTLGDTDSIRETTTHPAIRRLDPETVEQPAIGEPQAVSSVTEDIDDDVSWLRCANCGELNRAGQSHCFSCGQPINPNENFRITQPIDTLDSDGRDNFGEHDVLVLASEETGQIYRLALGQHRKEIILGRNTANPSMMPDIDLTDTSGNDGGVSRLHLSIRYDRSDNTVRIRDLTSANGTFLNGQRLHTEEVRVLHDGDQLKLGYITFQVTFQSPE